MLYLDSAATSPLREDMNYIGELIESSKRTAGCHLYTRRLKTSGGRLKCSFHGKYVAKRTP